MTKHEHHFDHAEILEAELLSGTRCNLTPETRERFASLRSWNDIRGKPLDDRGLASRLKPYGIKSRDVWIAGTNKKGDCAADFGLAGTAEVLGPTPGVDSANDNSLMSQTLSRTWRDEARHELQRSENKCRQGAMGHITRKGPAIYCRLYREDCS